MSNKTLALAAICFGFFMMTIDIFIVNVALPIIGHEMHASLSDLQWIVDGYALTFAGLLLSAGALGDRFGGKKIFIASLILFTIASLGCAVATQLWVLLSCRFLQGIGAAGLVPTSLALLNAIYPDQGERARAIGIWAAIASVAAAIAPALGAFLTAFFSWRSVFFVNLPIGIIAIFAAWKFIQQPTPRHKNPIDIAGQVFGIVTIAALVYGLIEAGRMGWSNKLVLLSLAIFVMSGIVFIVVEHRQRLPMLPLKLFRSPIFCTSLLSALILNFGYYGFVFVMPLYFHEVRDYSILLTGLAILPISGITFLSAYYGGRFTAKFGSRKPLLAGHSIMLISFIALFIAVHFDAAYWILMWPLFGIGIGAPQIMTAMTSAAMHTAPHEQAGLVSAVLNTNRQLGGLIGVAIFGTIITTASSFVHGMGISICLAVIAYLIGIVITLVWMKQT